LYYKQEVRCRRLLNRYLLGFRNSPKPLFLHGPHHGQVILKDGIRVSE